MLLHSRSLSTMWSGKLSSQCWPLNCRKTFWSSRVLTVIGANSPMGSYTAETRLSKTLCVTMRLRPGLAPWLTTKVSNSWFHFNPKTWTWEDSSSATKAFTLQLVGLSIRLKVDNTLQTLIVNYVRLILPLASNFTRSCALRAVLLQPDSTQRSRPSKNCFSRYGLFRETWFRRRLRSVGAQISRLLESLWLQNMTHTLVDSSFFSLVLPPKKSKVTVCLVGQRHVVETCR